MESNSWIDGKPRLWDEGFGTKVHRPHLKIFQYNSQTYKIIFHNNITLNISYLVCFLFKKYSILYFIK